MIILAYFIGAVANVLAVVLQLVLILVVVRAVISWFSPDPRNGLVRILTSSTEPLFKPIRRFVPNTGGIDWSPLVLILVVIFLQTFLVKTLLYYSLQIERSVQVSSVKMLRQ